MISIPTRHRNTAIAGGVVLFHVAALWALQSGLVRRAAEVVIPVEILSSIVAPETPPAPIPEPPAPPPPPPPRAKPKPAVAPPAPMPVAVPDPLPAPAAPIGVEAPQPPAPPITAPAAPPAPAAPVAAPAVRVESPMIDADYTANEDLFRAPPISRRLGEYGTVTLKVTVGVNGFATNVALVKSSGYERLDQAAMNGARKLKFRPATRGGIPVEGTYDLPVRYTERN